MKLFIVILFVSVSSCNLFDDNNFTYLELAGAKSELEIGSNVKLIHVKDYSSNDYLKFSKSLRVSDDLNMLFDRNDSSIKVFRSSKVQNNCELSLVKSFKIPFIIDDYDELNDSSFVGYKFNEPEKIFIFFARRIPHIFLNSETENYSTISTDTIIIENFGGIIKSPHTRIKYKLGNIYTVGYLNENESISVALCSIKLNELLKVEKISKYTIPHIETLLSTSLDFLQIAYLDDYIAITNMNSSLISIVDYEFQDIKNYSCIGFEIKDLNVTPISVSNPSYQDIHNYQIENEYYLYTFAAGNENMLIRIVKHHQPLKFKQSRLVNGIYDSKFSMQMIDLNKKTFFESEIDSNFPLNFIYCWIDERSFNVTLKDEVNESFNNTIKTIAISRENFKL